jgi:anti-anti-sigma factor
VYRTVEEGCSVVHVAGEHDLSSDDQFSDALAAACSIALPVVVDMSRLTFIDASGLGTLVAFNNGLIAEGRPSLLIRGTSGIVRRVFEITGLTSWLDDQATDLTWQANAAASALAGPRRLDVARREADLSVREVFVAYFALGGTAGLDQVTALLAGQPDVLDAHQRDVVAVAIDEGLADVGRFGRIVSQSR